MSAMAAKKRHVGVLWRFVGVDRQVPTAGIRLADRERVRCNLTID